MKPAPEKQDTAEDKLVFRKVSTQIHYDERFRALSPIPPCGRGLFLHMLIGPHLTSVPGLSHVGRAAMAEELQWDLADFDAAFAEVAAEGLAKADWTARVLWLPGALKHNVPANPKVVIGWRRFWPRIPDCRLKLEAYGLLKAGLEAIGSQYAKAFIDHCPKPTLNGSANRLVMLPSYGSASGTRNGIADSPQNDSVGDTPSLIGKQRAESSEQFKTPSQEKQSREVEHSPARAREGAGS